MAERETVKAYTPPFLFRAASSNGSRGLNTVDEIDPLFAYDAEYHEDLSSIPLPAARMMIRDHLNYEYHSASEFSSWSVSILFILVLAIRKAYSEGESDVRIYVMDTSRLQSSRIHSASELLKEYHLKWLVYRGKSALQSNYAEGEYLIHGRLYNCGGLWKAVTLDDLLDAGLEKLCPTLKTKELWHLLHQRLQQLRKGYFRFEGWDLVPWILDITKDVAASFGKEWEGVIMIALVTTRRRNLCREGVTAILNALKTTTLPQLPWSSEPVLRTIHLSWQGVLEAQQFMQLLRLLNDRDEAVKGGYDAERACTDTQTSNETDDAK